MTWELDPATQPPGEGAEDTQAPALMSAQQLGGWLKLARDAYQSSTDFYNANYRKRVDDSLRMFNNKHPSDSKYNSELYQKRSRIFRPKTRTILRKNEAAGAAAFFSSMDVVTVTAENQGNKEQVVSAEIMKQLLEYRLSKSIPWFLTCLGALQDAQTQGICIARLYWDYEQGKKDKPCAPLIPIENFRFDPACDWTDPVNTSPYLVELIPMYIQDVKARIETPDKLGRTWKPVTDGLLQAARSPQSSEATRLARQNGKEDQYDQNKPIKAYETVWVQRHIHRVQGEDYEFYTLSDLAMLSEPVPLSETVFTGERDYVVGICILEAHNPIPASVSELGEGLQTETNEIANQRLDNMKLALNKRYIVKRGRNVDIPSLNRNVAGGVTLADNPEEDVRELNWPDVTGSAYMEQDRVDNDFNELLGNFSAASLPNRDIAKSNYRMNVLQQPASSMTAYLLRTFVETFVEPFLRKLVKLIQKYETDPVVIALAGERAQVWQKYGVNVITDQMLNQELTLKVSAGMDMMDPTMQFTKLSQGLMTLSQISQAPIPGLNIKEVGEEMFGKLGYQDGKRFFTADPQVAALQQQMQQMQGVMQQMAQKLETKELEYQGKAEDRQAKFAMNTQNNEVKMAMQDKELIHDATTQLASTFIDSERELRQPN